MKSSTSWRVVVDTNVFISAFIWGGNPQKIINLWLSEKITLIISPSLLSEILLVLKRFHFSSAEIKKIKEILETHSLKVIPKKKVNICRDPKDNIILATCQDGKASYLITGDKDLLSLNKIKTTKILAPKNFLKIYRKKESAKK